MKIITNTSLFKGKFKKPMVVFIKEDTRHQKIALALNHYLNGRTYAETAREVEVAPQQVRFWVKKYEEGNLVLIDMEA